MQNSATTYAASSKSSLMSTVQQVNLALAETLRRKRREQQLDPQAVQTFAALNFMDDGKAPITAAPHHRLWLELVCDERIKKLLIIAPPGSAKTSWMSAYLATYIGFHPERSVIITSVADDVAEKRSLMLRSLTETDTWKYLFPDAPKSEKGKYEQKEWTLGNSVGRIHPTVRSYGTNASIIGSRADLILADDILDGENTYSQLQREKVETWFHTTLITRLKQNGRIIVIGTQYNAQDLYAHLRKDPTWTVCHVPLISDQDDGFYADLTENGVMRSRWLHPHKTLWTARWSDADAEALKTTTPPTVFETTYQGWLTSGTGTRVFFREWWDKPSNRYLPEGKGPSARYISLDTAESEKEGSAYTAWTVGDLMPDYTLRIVEIGGNVWICQH